MSYRDNIGWQKGIDLVEIAYRFTKTLPASENFGLVSQIQRAAVSIPANVAEGYGRGSKLDFARFVDIAIGSTRELQTHFEICKMLGIGSQTDEIEQAEKLAWTLLALRRSLRPD